jgi:hypothetical protein
MGLILDEAMKTRGVDWIRQLQIVLSRRTLFPSGLTKKRRVTRNHLSRR